MSSEYDQARPAKRAVLDSVNDLRGSHGIDGYLHIEWPVGDLHFSLEMENFEYWKRQWGFSRSGLPKGIAVRQLR
jgi:hypothetical protein